VDSPSGPVKVDMEWIRGSAGIRLPENELALRYSAKIRSDAFLHFGFFSFTGWVMKLLKKTAPDERAKGIQSLQKGVLRMKRETEKSISLHFKDYRENIKFQYIFKLSEAASRYLLDTLIQRLQDYASTLILLGQTADGRRLEGSQALETIQSSKAIALDIQERILQIRERIEGITQ